MSDHQGRQTQRRACLLDPPPTTPFPVSRPERTNGDPRSPDARCRRRRRHHLREAGIPFHNPYRRTNGFWNPLRVDQKGSTAGRVLALMAGAPDLENARPWTNGEVAQWAQVLQARGILVRGAKKTLAAFAPEHVATYVDDGVLAQSFEPEALESMARAWAQGHQALLDWWVPRLTADVRPRAAFPAEIVKRYGPHALVETPRVVVGTIHSVKGGQADIVYLFPDLSQAADTDYQRSGPPRDSILRVAYVGATRARERLVICQRKSAMAVAELLSVND